MFFNYSILRRARLDIESLEYAGVVVDLGCGTASYADFIESKGATYIGVDWPQSAHMRSRPIAEADLRGSVPLEDGCADIVTGFQVLEHIPNPENFVSECHRLLRPGGRLYLTTPFMWHIHEAPADYYRYTKYGLEYLVESAGFEVESIRETVGFWTVRALKLNYHVMQRFRGILGYLLAPLLMLNQVGGQLLDRVDFDADETGGYVLTASKPCQ